MTQQDRKIVETAVDYNLLYDSENRYLNVEPIQSIHFYVKSIVKNPLIYLITQSKETSFVVG